MLFGLILMAGVLYFIYSSNKATKPLDRSKNVQVTGTVAPPEPTATPVPPTPTPTPRPILHGTQSFLISQSNTIKGPKLGKFTIDPMDPSVGGKQMLNIEVNDTVPIQKVIATVKTDHKTYPEVEMKQVDGKNNTGHWQADWTIDDTILYTYVINVKAISASGTNSLDIISR